MQGDLGGLGRQGTPLLPPLSLGLLGLGFCASLAQIFFVSFFSGFHLPENRNVRNGFWRKTDFWCADSWCADFCAQIFALRFLVRKFFFDVLAFENRCSRVTQKCTENPQKNLRRPNGPARGVPHSISAFLSRQDVTQSPLGRRTQGEHVRVHRDIFGLKGMLAFAPRFFSNKNQRKIRSANH